MSNPTILIVDDEKNIREILGLYCAKEGFQVEEAADGVEAIRKVDQVKPGVIILDIMMPVLDGIEVCRQVRKFSSVPIIMLSARAEDEDRIMGLELGADDYIAKPFNPREVVARVNAVLRRVPDSEFSSADKLHFPNLDINIAEYTITASGRSVPLTAKEMELLWCLASRPGRTFSREILLEKIWGYTYCGETRTVDNHIRRLRQKIGASDTTPWNIKTVWGVGYQFEVRS
ncbi:response regulator transcription factor [Sporomusa sphaeroides]|uniref:response regulator transcription factor n=1 Tax=Sporomusa sphaeroides TaxID=47679 RepID=UPI002C121E4F|nr:response regulator transcription factor [Sporomusa sphaeroides]HML31971.1 response regulator transcription factor [Sporomusa sphaeroides]